MNQTDNLFDVTHSFKKATMENQTYRQTSWLVWSVYLWTFWDSDDVDLRMSKSAVINGGLFIWADYLKVGSPHHRSIFKLV